MAADITLFASAARTTTTKTDEATPRELAADVVGDAVDLVDNRALSLLLSANTPTDGIDNAIADVSVESSEDGVAGWREIARFTARPVAGVVVSERISCVADRYVRARARIAPRTNDRAKGSITFSVTGRAVGSAT